MFKQKLLDAALVGFTLGLGVIFYELVQGNMDLKHRLHATELKTSSLIAEVGQLKAEEEIRPMPGLQDPVIPVMPVLPISASNTPKIPRPVASAPKSEQKRTVILIIGQHQRLADSILLAIVNEAAEKVTLVSIPRDLYVNGRKMNEYLSLYGADVLEETVEKATGLNIDHSVIFNFRAFAELIDSLGGITLDVPKEIYDPLYPSGVGGYTLYNVRAGTHHMDGAEALQYARSRHSTSDFDRARRQQQIIAAVKEEFLRLNILRDAVTFYNFFLSLQSLMATDMSLAEMFSLGKLVKDFNVESGHVISTGNYLYASTNTAGQYILLPRGKTWDEIRAYIQGLL